MSDWLEDHQRLFQKYAQAGSAPPLESLLEQPLFQQDGVIPVPFIALVFDLRNGRTEYVSDSLEAILGIRPAEWLGKPASVLHERIFPADRPAVIRFSDSVNTLPEPRLITLRSSRLMVTYRFVSSNGDPRWVQSTSVPLYVNPDTLQPVYYLSVVMEAAQPPREGKPTASLSYENERGERVYIDLSATPQATIELTPRELTVLRLLAQGKTSREIGHQLDLTTESVSKVRKHLLDLTQSRNTAELVHYGLQVGLI